VKLRRLEMENFRQFYGTQAVTFSTDPEKNVTLIYGSNGGGKTTILNAFTWGLYGETTPGLADSEWLISHLAWSEATVGETVTARVLIEFEDGENVYELTRVQTASKKPDGTPARQADGTVKLLVTDAAGQNEELHNPDGAIGSILPKRLHRFAFFDGERDIEYLASPQATEEIKDAIKTVLGLEILDRAITHIKKARTSELRSEMSNVGDAEDHALAEKVSRLEEQDASYEAELSELKANLSATSSDLGRVEEELGKIQAAKELQERRKEVEGGVAKARKMIEEADAGIDARLRAAGFLAFVPSLVSAAHERAESLEKRGEIPAPIKQPFVQKLIADETCICGTHLAEGSRELEAVMAWFDKAGLPEVEQRWARIAANTVSFVTRRDELYLALNGAMRSRSDCERDLKAWEQKESEIDAQLTAVDDDEARNLNAKRLELKRNHESLNRQIGAVEQKRKQGQDAAAKAQTELESAKLQSEKAEKARRRLGVAREAEEMCKGLLAVRTQETRGELDERLKEVFGRMCFRPYVPALTDDFRLTLSTSLGGDIIPVSKSTGESQILALSFVGVMAELARKRYQDTVAIRDTAGLLSFHGGVFPLVLDAVFGTLDDTYQDGVADVLPTLAPQVIVLVTRGSAKDTIREKLWPATGKTIVCKLYTSKPGESDADVDTPNGTEPYRVAIAENRDRSELAEV
jgi:DNA sulfur modification protein DndD